MILSSPGAVAFSVFGFSVYWYGIIMALAIFAGSVIAERLYEEYFVSDDTQKTFLLDLLPWFIIVGFAGARIYYCLLNSAYYCKHFFAIFQVREGGLSIHGMFFSCAIFLFFYCKNKNLNFFSLAAPSCIGVALAQSIGRWGNFFNSEAFGAPYDGLIKLYIPPFARPEIYSSAEFFHPTFLYESILDFLIFLVLLFIVKKTKQSPLFLTSLYFLFYGIVRIVVESIRIDSIAFCFNLPIPLLVSLLLVFLSLGGLLLDLKSKFR